MINTGTHGRPLQPSKEVVGREIYGKWLMANSSAEVDAISTDVTIVWDHKNWLQ